MDSLLSFPVGLFHPLQHAGLSRRSPVCRRSKSYRTSTVQGASDAGVPGVAGFSSRRAEAFAKPFQTVCDRQAIDELDVLVADLSRKPHAKWPTVSYGKFIVVHAVTEKCLWMQSIGHIDAVPGVGFHRDVDNVSGLRLDSHEVQDVRERHADPLGNIRPTFFTSDLSDLAATGVAPKLRKRKRRGTVNHAGDGETPVSESSGLKTLVRIIEGRHFVDGRRF